MELRELYLISIILLFVSLTRNMSSNSCKVFNRQFDPPESLEIKASKDLKLKTDMNFFQAVQNGVDYYLTIRYDNGTQLGTCNEVAGGGRTLKAPFGDCDDEVSILMHTELVFVKEVDIICTNASGGIILIIDLHDCLRPADQRGIIPFRDDNNSPVLSHGTQVIITSYQFQCCGNITEWRTMVQRQGGGIQYSIAFQVWRPSPTVHTDGCYSLVGENTFTSITNNKGLVRETPGPTNMISVQPGDVVGYFSTSDQNNVHNGIQLDVTSTNESVWFHIFIEDRSVIPASEGSCPLPVGSSMRSLSTLTKAAPVLSVSLSTFPCTPSTTPLPVQMTPSEALVQPTPTSGSLTLNPTKTLLSTTILPQTTMPSETTSMSPETSTVPPETTTMPPETTTMPPETITVPSETTTVPPETTTVPPETTTMPPETTTVPSEMPPIETTIPPETTAIPPETTSVPPETTVIPPETTTMPQETTIMPPATTAMSPERTTVPPKTTTVPPEPTTMLPETMTPPETTTVPPETTIMPPETTTMPPETTVPPETTIMPPETTIMPPEPTTVLPEAITVTPLAKFIEAINNISVTNLTDPIISSIVNTIDELIRTNRSEELRKDKESGQEVLLEAIEDFSQLLANGTLLLSNDTEFNVTDGENINIKVQRLSPATENSIAFNLTKDAAADEAEAGLYLPPEAIATNTAVVAIIAVRGLAGLLDSVVNNQSGINPVMSIGDLVTINFLVEQEGVIEKVTQFPENNPLVLRFPIGNSKVEACVWWNTTARNWSDDGIRSDVDEDNNTVLCSISHLTSFSVLVSPTGVTAKTEAEETALSIVSYIGCIISSVFLILTIVSLIWFRKILNKGPLLYVHLNLSIALLVSLLIFVSTVERATAAYALCVVTTSFLHYFLLASFCWMLCEGILLYLMVVRVFGTAAKKWYWFLPLGWGLPVPVVTISAGVLEGLYDSYTHYPDHCWLNAGVGAAAIWTFIVPMVIIIIINAVILVMTLCSIVKGRRKGGAEYDVKKKALAKTVMKSLIFLLPLMGVTWVIGLFAVEENTTVFAWLFTIFNSLQGASVFILHVARNEGFQRKLLSWFKSNCKTSSYGTTGATIFSDSAKVSSLDNDNSSYALDIKEHSLSLKRLT